MTIDPAFNTPNYDATTTRLHAEYQQRPLNLARRLLNINHSDTAKRDYLRETGSPYADSDANVMAGAFSGHVLNALASLADAYEHEITHG